MPQSKKNSDRADLAGEAMNRFVEVADLSGEPPEDVLTDLLTNLLHLCDKLDISFTRAFASADEHYTAERKETDANDSLLTALEAIASATDSVEQDAAKVRSIKTLAENAIRAAKRA